MEGYTPGTDSPQPSQKGSASTAPQTLSLPDIIESGEDGDAGEIDIEGTISFFQVVFDGFVGLADFIQNTMEAFSEIGN